MRNTLTVAMLFVCIKTGSGLLSQKPQDSAAVIGKSAYFNCSTSEPLKRIQWYHYDVDEAQREAIYRCDNSIEYWYPCYRNGRYIVDKNQVTGAYNLVIPTVVSSDAGRFLCEVDGDEGMANLTVRVESNPTCVASEICKPYIKPYSDAIICICVIILPTLIVGTLFVLWYLRVYRPKKLNQKEKNVGESEGGNSNNIVSSQEETKQLMSTTDDSASKHKDLEKEKEEQAIRIKVLENDLIRERNEVVNQKQKLSEEIKTLQGKNEASDSKISRLRARVKDLEQSFYPAASIDYTDKPIRNHTIITDAARELHRPINGMTILGRDLFVSNENNTVIEVFDSETFKCVHNWEIKGMLHPMDIASCKIANCVYIIHREDNESESLIMKLEPRGKLIKEWSTGGDSGRLSTYESHVIVCLFEKQLLNEYNRDGKLIQTVPLSPALNLNHPWHAIKITSSHFVVCHGEARDELHRVCIVDVQGNIIKKLGLGISQKLNVPICILQDSERSILIADRDNQRIRLMDCLLNHQMSLIRKETELEGYPVRICLDEAKGRLFVAENTLRSNRKEWTDGKILIFKISSG